MNRSAAAGLLVLDVRVMVWILRTLLQSASGFRVTIHASQRGAPEGHALVRGALIVGSTAPVHTVWDLDRKAKACVRTAMPRNRGPCVCSDVFARRFRLHGSPRRILRAALRSRRFGPRTHDVVEVRQVNGAT